MNPLRGRRRGGPPSIAEVRGVVRHAVRIGLTGPIGCGKSTVAGWLGELGAIVIDADQVSRDVVQPGEPALLEVLAAFGDGVRAPDGALDRAALGRVVFADPDALALLEGILHPVIHERILAAMAAADAVMAPAVVVEAIKLVESGLADTCHEIWLVTCTGQAQRARLGARGLAPEVAAERIRAQGGSVAGGTVTDGPVVVTRVIETSGPLEATRAAVSEVYRAALERAKGT